MVIFFIWRRNTMLKFVAIFSVLCLLSEAGYVYEEPIYYDTFPNGFEWGVATAAYQVKSRSWHSWSTFDPLGRSTITVGGDHCLHTCYPSVPTFQNLAKQNKFQAKTMFTTGEIVGLAEWIIDDTCLVLSPLYFVHLKTFWSICPPADKVVIIFTHDMRPFQPPSIWYK